MQIRPLPVLFGATGETVPRAPILITAVLIIHSTPRVKPTNSNLTLLVRLRANERNNSQHSSANNVGSCCVRVGSGMVCKRMQQLPATKLGPAVHRRKDTAHTSL